MNKLKYIFLPSMAVLMMATSCEMKKEIMDEIDSSKAGKWVLSVDAEDEIAPVQIISKAASSVDVDDFQVQILDNTNTTVKSYAHYRDLKEEGTLILEQGNYTVTVSSGDLLEAAFNAPNFAATEAFSIVPRTITRTDLVCELQNVKVTVDCSENFKNSFKPDYAVNVTNGKGILVFAKDTTGAGYFKPSNMLKLSVVATTLDGRHQIFQTFNLNEQKENGLAEAKDYFKVTLDIKDLVGSAVKPTIMADLTLNERDEEVLVPTEPEVDPTPDPDPTPTNGPVLTTTGFTFGVPLVFAQSADPKPTVIVDVDASAGEGLENLIVNIESDYLMPLLPFAVPIDLAHMTPAETAVMSELGLPTDVLGKEQVRFDISTFMGPLAAGTGTTTFTLTFTDKKENSSTGKIITTVTE